MIQLLQQFVLRLVEDETFRHTATRDPEAAVAGFGLRGPERQGALKLCAQMAGGDEVHPNNTWWLF